MLFAMENPVDIAAWVTAISTTGMAGFLAFVLRWLLFTHLPAKDTQIERMLNIQAEEREKDRKARHDQIHVFQEAVAQAVGMSSSMSDRMEIRWEQSLVRMEADFNARSALQREHNRESQLAIMAHCDRESSRREEMLKIELSENAAALKDVRLALEELRDDRRDRTSRRVQVNPNPNSPK